MVTKFLPMPANSGGKQRSLAVARRLSQHYDLMLCAYDDGTADVGALKEMGIDARPVAWEPSIAGVARATALTRSVSAGRFQSPAMSAAVRQAGAEAPLDLLQVEYLQMAPAATGVSAATRVLDLHNVESALTASYGRARAGARSLPYRLESLALRAMERRVVPGFDVVVVVSERERDRLPPGARRVLVCPNGWDVTSPLPPSPTPTAAFVANMGWAPNVDAARWLCAAVWPEVRRRLAEARLLLVGRDPAPSVAQLATASVEVTGTVSDVRPYLSRTRVALAPLRAGGGTRLKILEALDAGRPVVATSVAVDGLEDLVGRGVVVADEPAAMADAVVGLLTDAERANALGLEGHRAVAEGHSWKAALRPLAEAVVS